MKIEAYIEAELRERPAALAHEFSSILRDWLTEEEMAEVLTRNAVETNQGVCHSHDFCDANMVMLDAMRNLGISSPFEGGDERMYARLSLINEAWDIAKANGFKV